MLLMKAWLETRWRFLLMLGVALLTIIMGEQGGGLGSAEHAQNLMLLQSFLSLLAAIQLAGAGIRTQSPFRAKAGLHGSTQYTLSLPVSRTRLLAIRAGFGLLEAAGVVVIMTVLAWSLFPLVRGNSTIIDLLKLCFAKVACTWCFYFVSVVIATVLDEMWQVYGSYCVVGLAWWASVSLPLPASVNVLGFMTASSTSVAHSLPWTVMGTSVAISVVLFLVALRIVESYKY